MSESLREQLNKNKISVFVPRGNSMFPFLKNKGQSVIVSAKEGRLNYLDAGLYINKRGENVLHRIIEIKDDGYIFIGDHTLEKEFVPEDNVCAVMIGFYHGKKFVDVNTEKYKKKVAKFYADFEKRNKRIRRDLRRRAFKNKIRTTLYRLLKGRRKNV